MDARGKQLLVGLVALLGAATALAQPMRSRGFPPIDETGPYVRIEGGLVINEDTVRSAREIASHSTGTAEWKNPSAFAKDVFTFARVQFKTNVSTSNGWGGGRRFGWWVDFPDADLNFSYRLQQLTSTRTDPDGRVVRLTEPELFDYPLIYMEHCGYMRLSEDEIKAFRKYLVAGGALLVNDFWGSPDWDGFAEQMKRVLPERNWVDLTMDHPIFHCVFELKGPMNRLQVPTMQLWNRAHTPDDRESPLHTVPRGVGSEDMHIRALLDDKGRIMVIAIHNSDVSDGWEREGENDDYFHTFSEKIAYPLGINIVFYLMTH